MADLYFDLTIVTPDHLYTGRVYAGSTCENWSGAIAHKVEPVLAEYFEECGFDPEKYEAAQMAYVPINELVKAHGNKKSDLIVPLIVEFAGIAKSKRNRKSKKRKGFATL